MINDLRTIVFFSLNQIQILHQTIACAILTSNRESSQPIKLFCKTIPTSFEQVYCVLFPLLLKKKRKLSMQIFWSTNTCMCLKSCLPTLVGLIPHITNMIFYARMWTMFFIIFSQIIECTVHFGCTCMAFCNSCLRYYENSMKPFCYLITLTILDIQRKKLLFSLRMLCRSLRSLLIALN